MPGDADRHLEPPEESRNTLERIAASLIFAVFAAATLAHVAGYLRTGQWWGADRATPFGSNVLLAIHLAIAAFAGVSMLCEWVDAAPLRAARTLARWCTAVLAGVVILTTMLGGL